ncbi:MAG: alpha/beta hydrolase [Verrucomicrobia bacterium]|nr:alpha/beta hydrolase [Verrucomicrobiota bacterium]
MSAQTPADLPPPSRTIDLYEGVAPGSEAWHWAEHTFVTRFGNTVTRNVVKPTLQYYPADRAKAAGVAVIVAPGGGFTDLMIKYEGVRTALALNALGVDAFILKYRLIYVDPAVPLPAPGEKTPPPPQKSDDAGNIIWGPQKGQNIFELTRADARRALSWVRANAADLGYAPDKAGIIGFSAGALLSLYLALDKPAYRPDFAGVIYGPDHHGRPIPADAPPIFIAVAADDGWSSGLSLNLFQAWREAKRPAELHVFQTGAHGFLNNGGGGDFFMDRFAEWMRANGWLKAATAGTGPLFR